MQPHPDFAGHSLPREADLGPCHLTPLTMAQTDEDFAVVTASAPVLHDIFDDWPSGLTFEDNRIDLAWHDREFTLSRSFSWIIRDPGGAYLGCLYLFPALGTCGEASGALWFRDMPDRAPRAAALTPLLQDWLRSACPAGLKITWTCSPKT